MGTRSGHRRRKRAVRQIFRKYRAPIAMGTVFTVLLALWGWTEWQAKLENDLDRLRQYANGLALSVEVEIHRRSVRGMPASATEVEAALTTLISRTPQVKYAALYRDGLLFAAAGPIPNDVNVTGESGEEVRPEVLLHWMQIRAEPPRPHGPRPDGRGPPGGHGPPRDDGDRRGPPGFDGRRPPPPGPPPRWADDDGHPDGESHDGGAEDESDHRRWRGPPSFGEDGPDDEQSAYVLLFGLDRTAPDQARHDDMVDVASKVGFAFFGLLALFFAWALGIRSRAVSHDLEQERRKRAHHEELGLAAAGLAHETKNPLGIISGLAQRIEGDPEISDKAREAVGHIIDAADRAAVRLGEFMNYAKQADATMVPIDAKVTLSHAVEVLQPDYESAGVSLSTDLRVDRIVADEEMLIQIVLNLLLNSLQASAAGRSVTLTLRPDEEFAALVVADEGSGIDPELLADVTKPYVSGRHEGHGLGLSIVKRLVDSQGWQLSLSSLVGEGTIITLSGIEIDGAQAIE